MRRLFVGLAVEPAGRLRPCLTVRGSWIRSRGLINRPVGGFSRGQLNH